MPDAELRSIPAVPAGREGAFARLLQRLYDQGAAPADGLAANGLAAEGLAAAGVRAWLRALAAPRFGRAWSERHLGPGPALGAELCTPDPAAIQRTYATLQGLQAGVADGRVRLVRPPFARQQAGAYYTPDRLIALVLSEARVDRAPEVVDPACGPGGFLVAALPRLVAGHGEAPATAARRLGGIDRDPLAVACARVAVALAATPDGGPAPELTDRIVAGDALLDAAPWRTLAADAGVATLVGNPPWERAKLQEVEWLAARDPEFRGLSATDRRARLVALAAAGDPLTAALAAERSRRAAYARALRLEYPETCRGDANLYAGFAALAARRLADHGRAALLVPSGIAADRGASGFVGQLARQGRLAAILDFENRGDGRAFFPDVDPRFKFACLAIAGPAGRIARSRLAFNLRTVAEVRARPPLALSPRALRTLNPNTGGLPVLTTRADAALALVLHRRAVPLVDRRGDPVRAAFPVRYRRMLDMTNDAHRFRPARRAAPGDLPLYEGKMVQAFDHRAAGVAAHAQNLKRPGQPRPTTEAERADPGFRPQPRFVVAGSEVDWPAGLDWAIGVKHVTSPTNARTVIAAVVPRCAAANSLPLLLPAATDTAGLAAYRRTAPLLLANLNALVLDWLARTKVQGQNLNLYILEQLPVIPPDAYPPGWAAAIRGEVRQLSYTARDLAGFARDLGFDGPPAVFDPAERRRLRARLDARYARLYGLDRRQFARVLAGFPQLARQERAAYGRFLTGRNALRAFNRLA